MINETLPLIPLNILPLLQAHLSSSSGHFLKQLWTDVLFHVLSCAAWMTRHPELIQNVIFLGHFDFFKIARE